MKVAQVLSHLGTDQLCPATLFARGLPILAPESVSRNDIIKQEIVNTPNMCVGTAVSRGRGPFPRGAPLLFRRRRATVPLHAQNCLF